MMMRSRFSRTLTKQATAVVSPLAMQRRFASEEAAKPEDAKAPEIEPEHEKTIKELRAQLKEAEEKITELKKDYAYACAETENVRRIGREDVEKARNFGLSSFSKDLLEVPDSLDMAISEFKKVSESEMESNKVLKGIYTGVKMSSSVMLKVLSKHGIEKIDVKVGETFDPHRHEALFQAPATEEIPNGHVTMCVKTGYMIKDRILRASQVGVAE